MLVCFLVFAREAAGALGTRLSLRPLFFRGQKVLHSSGAFAPRECGRVSRHCERQRSNPFFLYAAMWIASLALAMTMDRLFEIRIGFGDTATKCRVTKI
jgi:hypothetical protein